MSPRERMNECLAFLDLRNLQISLDCAAQSLDTRKSADCADPANALNRRAGPLMKIVCISSSDRTFKITVVIFTCQNLSYPIGPTSKDTRMFLALLDKPVQPEDVQQKRSRPEEHQRNSCILWKTKLATSRPQE